MTDNIDKIKVYRVGQDPIYLDPGQIVFVDRTRMEIDCKWKRFVEYELDGLGFVPAGRNEHLVIGAAVHEGMDLLLQGGRLEKAMEVARLEYLNAPPWPESWPQERKDLLSNDSMFMVYAFLYAFNDIYLPKLLDEYDVMEVEEETNWLLYGDPELSQFRIVVMSRLDSVLRRKETGRLWHVSHKTHGRAFDQTQLDKLKPDIQRFSEGYAIWAKYGEAPEGTLYNYFLKGSTYFDKEFDCDRYTTGLIRPWLNRLAMGESEITPEMISFVHEWDELDEKSMTIKGRRLGKGWEKVNIYDEMDYTTYLEWLSKQMVARESRNYLAESVVGMVQVPWNVNHAERWRIGTANNERDWAWKTNLVGRFQGEVTGPYHMAQEFPLNSGSCFDYNKKCPLFSDCWEDEGLDSLKEKGHIVPRTPNHLVELRKIT